MCRGYLFGLILLFIDLFVMKLDRAWEVVYRENNDDRLTREIKRYM